MHKHHAQFLYDKIKHVKPWYFLVIAGVSFVVSVYGLRQNNLEMVRLREEVYKADKSNGDVRTALTNLQRHVTSRMNTDLTAGSNPVKPPIQLLYTYERLQAANIAKSSNEKVYIDAQAYCEAQNPTDFSGRNRVPCIQDYVSTNGAKLQNIPDSLYKFDFVSPSWSPDLAGWTAVVTVVSLLIAAKLWILKRFFK